MFKKTPIFVFLLFLVFHCLAQQPTLKELEQKVQHAANVQEKIEARNKLVKVLSSSDPGGAIKYGQETVTIAQATGDQKLLADAYHHVGAAYQLYGDYTSATKYNYKALKIREEIKDSLGICTTYNNIGNINNYLKSYDKAREFYSKSLQIAQKIGNKEAISRALNNMGYAHQVQDHVNEAIHFYERALPIKKEIGDVVGYSVSTINLGDLYLKAGKVAVAKDYLLKGLAAAKETEHQLNMGYAYRGLAEAYQEEKKLAKAVDYALLSLEISRKQRSFFEIIQSLDLLNQIHLASGNVTKAHEFLSLSSAYKDSLHDENARRQIEELQVRYDSEKKEKENIQLTTERDLQLNRLNHQKKVTYLACTLLLSFAALAYVLFRGKKQFRRLSHTLALKNEEITVASQVLRQQATDLQTQKELLEKSNLVKDRLFSIVAHDLRGPLVSLNSLVQLIRMNALPEKEKNRFLDKVELEQQNSLWLMDNLFLWAKSQMEEEGTHPVQVQLQTLAQENINLLLPQANNKGIQIINQLSGSAVAFADYEMVKLVFRNLLSNAIKFCKSGDVIVLASEVHQQMATISVKDSGVGIPEKDQDKLFKNTNFSSTGTANEKGTGLGLQLCKDFIELNGGEIWVESKEGQGSDFRFTLPVMTERVGKEEVLEQVEVRYA
ncbi:tetratricopeptide repeat-containing sensor histidine kinase [Rufibacter roseus]|uniref:histidine kinase n=1 Tax=Rufibacter roseus TaxID=1567108 RepID=A0ABW2DJ87_9BACT|nr:tetratricopeptide repeat protein [Rufibacter roseus]